MKEGKIVVVNPKGIHARPATMVTRKANEFSSTIQIEKDGVVADARSIMSIMILAAKKGSQVTLRVNGEDEDAAYRALKELLESDFEGD